MHIEAVHGVILTVGTARVIAVLACVFSKDSAGLFLVVALALANQHSIGIKCAVDKCCYLFVLAGCVEAAHSGRCLCSLTPQMYTYLRNLHKLGKI